MDSIFLEDIHNIEVSTNLLVESYIEEMEETGLYEEGVGKVFGALKRSTSESVDKAKGSINKVSQKSLRKKLIVQKEKLEALPPKTKVKIPNIRKIEAVAKESEEFTVKLIDNLRKDLQRAFKNDSNGFTVLDRASEEISKRYEDFERKMVKAGQDTITVTASEAIQMLDKFDPVEYVDNYSNAVFHALDRMKDVYNELAPVEEIIKDVETGEVSEKRKDPTPIKKWEKRIQSDQETGRRDPNKRQGLFKRVARYFSRANRETMNWCMKHSYTLRRGLNIVVGINAATALLALSDSDGAGLAGSAAGTAIGAGVINHVIKREAKARFNESEEAYQITMDKEYILLEAEHTAEIAKVLTTGDLICESYLGTISEDDVYEESIKEAFTNAAKTVKKMVAAVIEKIKNFFKSIKDKIASKFDKAKRKEYKDAIENIPPNATIEVADYKSMDKVARSCARFTSATIMEYEHKMNALSEKIANGKATPADKDRLTQRYRELVARKTKQFATQMKEARNRKIKISIAEAKAILDAGIERAAEGYFEAVNQSIKALDFKFMMKYTPISEAADSMPPVIQKQIGVVKNALNTIDSFAIQHAKVVAPALEVLGGTLFANAVVDIKGGGRLRFTHFRVKKNEHVGTTTKTKHTDYGYRLKQATNPAKTAARDAAGSIASAGAGAGAFAYAHHLKKASASINESTEMEDFDTMENIYMEGANVDLQRTCHTAKKVFNKEMRDMKRNIRDMDFKGAAENAKAAEEAIKTVKSALKKYPAGDLTANLLGSVIGFGKITVKSLAWSLVPLFGNVKAVMDGFRLSDAAITTKWKSIKNRQEGKQDHTMYNTLYVDCVKWLESMERKLAKVSQKLRTMKALDAITKESVMDHMVAEEDEKYLLAQFESVDPEMLDLMYCEGFLDTEDYIELYKEATEEEYVDDIFDESANEFDFDFESDEEYDESYDDYEDDDYYEGYEDDEDYDFDDFDL